MYDKKEYNLLSERRAFMNKKRSELLRQNRFVLLAAAMAGAAMLIVYFCTRMFPRSCA